MSWLLLSIGAYFLLGVAALVDKSLLKKAIPDPRIYAFFVGILGLAALVLAPFGISWPGWHFVIVSFLTGVLFIFSLILLFTALQRSEASRVIPFVGAIQPICIFLLSSIFLNEELSGWQILAFVFLVVGGIIISIQKEEKKIWSPTWFLPAIDAGMALIGIKRPDRKARTLLAWLLPAIGAGITFACFYVLTKYIFLNQSFINGFVWPRIGAAVAVLLLLLDPLTRKGFRKTEKTSTKKTPITFLSGQTAGALGFVALHYAISLGSITLINAMQGVQYVFVFLAALMLSKRMPRLLDEKMTSRMIFQKTIAILFIVLGIILLWI